MQTCKQEQALGHGWPKKPRVSRKNKRFLICGGICIFIQYYILLTETQSTWKPFRPNHVTRGKTIPNVIKGNMLHKNPDMSNFDYHAALGRGVTWRRHAPEAPALSAVPTLSVSLGPDLTILAQRPNNNSSSISEARQRFKNSACDVGKAPTADLVHNENEMKMK